MPASFSEPTANTSASTNLGQKTAHVAPLIVSPVLLLVALLGLGWLYVPANPAIKAPATTFGFDDLHDLANSGAVPTTWLQQNYFGWLGWTVVLAVTALAIVTALTGKRVAAIALAGAGLISLVVTLFAVKGELTWGQFGDQIPNFRAGGYCALLGYLIALGFGGVRSARR